MISNVNRRAFLQAGATALTAAALPVRILTTQELSQRGDPHATILSIGSPELTALMYAGLDAAKRAGATYADIVFCSTRKETWENWRTLVYMTPTETLTTNVGIRALVNGYWGFSGLDGLATTDIMAEIGRTAVAHAKNGAQGTPRTVDLAPAPVVTNGHWIMPVEIDPFDVSYGEKIDYINAMCAAMLRIHPGVRTNVDVNFVKRERTFASTDGTLTSQMTYTSACALRVVMESHFSNGRMGARAATFLTPAGAGWEYFRRAPYQEQAEQLVEEAARTRTGKPIEIGRWDTVFDADAVASILGHTIGPATELDRVMGYEANGIGTSFLNDPLAMLGTQQIGSKLVNISANRSMSGGAATVKWDDEGVEPTDMTLVKDGILTDFQTSRESASWLAPYYSRLGRPVRSNGCAGRAKASLPTTQCPPNFVLAPGTDDVTFDDLVADTKRGYAVVGGRVWSDHQSLNGGGRGALVYEIRDGKLTDTVHGALYQFRAPEFWKSVVGLGGMRSQRALGNWWSRVRGHRLPYTVAAVPAKVTQLAFIDMMRKA